MKSPMIRPIPTEITVSFMVIHEPTSSTGKAS